MPLFSRYHTPTSAFPTDVFRLLEDLSHHSTTTSTSPSSTTANRRAFTPNFDVHETDAAFILEGELPGMEDKSKVNIEFTDDNTMLIRGKIERKAHFDHAPVAPDGAGEDDSEKEKEKQVVKKDAAEKEKEENTVRYWVSERSVGEFQRSFSFPGAVDLDAVRASLEDGILRIVVPKKEVVKGRRIEIS